MQSAEAEGIGWEVVVSQEIGRGVEVEQGCCEEESSQANRPATWPST